MTATQHELRIVDKPDAKRYEAYVGDELAGFADYHAQPGLLTILHTEIDPAFEGQGVGSRFVAGMLDEVRSQGGRVLPICPFVLAFLQRHAEYRDLVWTR
jgi:uncharacterized protein